MGKLKVKQVSRQGRNSIFQIFEDEPLEEESRRVELDVLADKEGVIDRVVLREKWYRSPGVVALTLGDAEDKPKWRQTGQVSLDDDELAHVLEILKGFVLKDH